MRPATSSTANQSRSPALSMVPVAEPPTATVPVVWVSAVWSSVMCVSPGQGRGGGVGECPHRQEPPGRGRDAVTHGASLRENREERLRRDSSVMSVTSIPVCGMRCADASNGIQRSLLVGSDQQGHLGAGRAAPSPELRDGRRIRRAAGTTCEAAPQTDGACDPLLSDMAWTAGTGRSHFDHRAGVVLPELSEGRFDYTYTDILAGFFPEAESRFAGAEASIDYRVPDIGNDPAVQGFDAHGYALVDARKRRPVHHPRRPGGGEGAPRGSCRRYAVGSRQGDGPPGGSPPAEDDRPGARTARAAGRPRQRAASTPTPRPTSHTGSDATRPPGWFAPGTAPHG